MEPTSLTSRRPQTTPLKRGLGSIGPENVRPVIAPVDHMVTRSGKFQSQLAGHARQLGSATSILDINIRSLTLFVARGSVKSKADALAVAEVVVVNRFNDIIIGLPK